MSQNSHSVSPVRPPVYTRHCSKPTSKKNSSIASVTSLTDLWEKIHCMFSHINENLEARIQSCTADLERRISGLEKQLIAVNNEWTTDVNILSRTTSDLRSEVDRNARNLCRLENSQDLIITGIPFHQDENLDQVFNSIADGLGVTAADFRLVHLQRISRIPISPETCPPILCQFAFRRLRDDFFRIYLRHRSLTLHDIGFNTNKRVYINESLDSQTRALLRAAIKLRRSGRLHKVSTRKGTVTVKIHRDGEPMIVTSIDQLMSTINTNLSI